MRTLIGAVGVAVMLSAARLADGSAISCGIDRPSETAPGKCEFRHSIAKECIGDVGDDRRCYERKGYKFFCMEGDHPDRQGGCEKRSSTNVVKECPVGMSEGAGGICNVVSSKQRVCPNGSTAHATKSDKCVVARAPWLVTCSEGYQLEGNECLKLSVVKPVKYCTVGQLEGPGACLESDGYKYPCADEEFDTGEICALDVAPLYECPADFKLRVLSVGYACEKETDATCMAGYRQARVCLQGKCCEPESGNGARVEGLCLASTAVVSPRTGKCVETIPAAASCASGAPSFESCRRERRKICGALPCLPARPREYTYGCPEGHTLVFDFKAAEFLKGIVNPRPTGKKDSEGVCVKRETAVPGGLCLEGVLEGGNCVGGETTKTCGVDNCIAAYTSPQYSSCPVGYSVVSDGKTEKCVKRTPTRRAAVCEDGATVYDVAKVKRCGSVKPVVCREGWTAAATGDQCVRTVLYTPGDREVALTSLARLIEGSSTTTTSTVPVGAAVPATRS